MLKKVLTLTLLLSLTACATNPQSSTKTSGFNLFNQSNSLEEAREAKTFLEPLVLPYKPILNVPVSVVTVQRNEMTPMGAVVSSKAGGPRCLIVLNYTPSSWRVWDQFKTDYWTRHQTYEFGAVHELGHCFNLIEGVNGKSFDNGIASETLSDIFALTALVSQTNSAAERKRLIEGAIDFRSPGTFSQVFGLYGATHTTGKYIRKIKTQLYALPSLDKAQLWPTTLELFKKATAGESFRAQRLALRPMASLITPKSLSILQHFDDIHSATHDHLAHNCLHIKDPDTHHALNTNPVDYTDHNDDAPSDDLLFSH